MYGKGQKKILWQLRERVKELNALHRISGILQRRGHDIPGVMAEVIKVLTRAWQYPQLAKIRIRYHGRSYASPGFVKTRWRQAARMSLPDGRHGTIEVCYRQRPKDVGRLFLPEEARLLRSVASQLKSFFIRRQAEERLVGAKQNLERMVASRTRQLRQLNRTLRLEVAERRRREKEIKRYQARLKLLALQLAMFEEQERREIAADLHDHIGQTLMMIRIKLAALRTEPGERELRESLPEIESLLNQAINYTRDLTFEVIPPMLYELGLEAALEWLAEYFRDKYRLEVSLQGSWPRVQLDRKLLFVLYMAVRELLFNIVKHASANRAEVWLETEERNLIIRVADDGRGFDPARAERRVSATSGYGLFSIREKLHYFAGVLRIASQPGQGTNITITVPIDNGDQR